MVWDGHGFFDGFREYQRVHRGDANTVSSVVGGLRADNDVLVRVRAQGYSGYSEWSEPLKATTLPLPDKQRGSEALPLPIKWLQLDVADIIRLHVSEIGGEPIGFFRELAKSFTPHVRSIRRLFQGWSRAGLVGTKMRLNELSQKQFLRFCKEVGLLQGGGTMCERSSAKMLSLNHADRLFQRANIDMREGDASPSSRRKEFDAAYEPARLAEAAREAYRECSPDGAVAEDDEADELREKLRPIFDQFDAE